MASAAVQPEGAGRCEYFDHDADIGIVGRGRTVETAFQAAAEAMFAVMIDPAQVRAAVEVRVAFEESDLDLALVPWLNRLLAEARGAGLVLGRFSLRREGDRWCGEAWGEPWGEPWREELGRGVEVKGATLTMLRVAPTNDGWEAACVVDV
jgi:SHS2 domain-containing protein